MSEATKYRSVLELLPKYDTQENMVNLELKQNYFQRIIVNDGILKGIHNLTDIIEKKIQMNFLDLNLKEKILQLCQVDFQQDLRQLIIQYEDNMFNKVNNIEIKVKKNRAFVQENQQENKIIKKGNYTPLKQHKEWYQKILKRESNFKKRLKTAKMKENQKKEKQRQIEQENFEKELENSKLKRIELNQKCYLISQ